MLPPSWMTSPLVPGKLLTSVPPLPKVGSSTNDAFWICRRAIAFFVVPIRSGGLRQRLLPDVRHRPETGLEAVFGIAGRLLAKDLFLAKETKDD